MNRDPIAINTATQAYFFRDPDRPSTSYVPKRPKQDPDVKRAKAKMRTAAWRARRDQDKCPETRDIGMSLLTALVTSPDLGNMTGPAVRIVGAALADLEARGFDREQIKLVMRRFRSQVINR